MANIDLQARIIHRTSYHELLTDATAERISIFIFLSLKGRNRKEYREIFRRVTSCYPIFYHEYLLKNISPRHIRDQRRESPPKLCALNTYSGLYSFGTFSSSMVPQLFTCIMINE